MITVWDDSRSIMGLPCLECDQPAESSRLILKTAIGAGIVARLHICEKVVRSIAAKPFALAE